ncbi:hypothetical protein PoB_000376800 [Plakobranchus ocellatus]|uniref:Uncharacterized protein n=1 Tax=Plakobranchus ocellatus TaxID=259542 RepID=A0AAV3Y4F8_9GAST|nr:hypothetical protein PoB_000376800 [Plakobranchus ocellatus]
MREREGKLFHVLEPVDGYDYCINVNGKEKTFYANLFKRNITRAVISDEALLGDRFGSAARPALWRSMLGIAAEMTGWEVLPELGGWGSKETVMLGDELCREERRELEKLSGPFSSDFIDCTGSTKVEAHVIEVTSSTTI